MSCLIRTFVSPVDKFSGEETSLQPDPAAYIPLGTWLGYPISLRTSPGKFACVMGVASFVVAAAVLTTLFYAIPTILNTTATSMLATKVITTLICPPAFVCFGVIGLANGLLARGDTTGEYEYQ